MPILLTYQGQIGKSNGMFAVQCIVDNKSQRIPKRQSKMDNAVKLATQSMHDEEKHNTIGVGHHYSQVNTNNINKTNKQLECKALQIVVYPFVFFSFDQCVVCPSSIDGFWLTLWYLQVLLNTIREYLYMYTVNSNEFTVDWHDINIWLCYILNIHISYYMFKIVNVANLSNCHGQLFLQIGFTSPLCINLY